MAKTNTAQPEKETGSGGKLFMDLLAAEPGIDRLIDLVMNIGDSSDCQRCGKLGGKVVTFFIPNHAARDIGVLLSRWICPHCLDETERWNSEGWIPVEREMPPDDMVVLVSISGGPEGDVFSLWTEEGEWVDLDPDDEVTHWMPLPSPPIHK